ncbi:MAG: type I 3-dehydroquinate dehydratase [Nitrospirota bacterium]
MKFGNLVFGTAPKIVLSLSEAVFPLYQKRSCPFDIVEMRIDLFNQPDSDLLHFIDSFTGFPTIATIRSKSEGGQWGLSELKRLSLFRKIMPIVSAVDIELSSKAILKEVVDCAHHADKKVIVSYHDFDQTLSRRKLDQIFNQAKRAGADIVKVAAFAKRDRDIRRLAEFTLAHADGDVVTIGMGEKGALSRLFFPALGSLFTYGYMGKQTAPGQMDCKELSALMKRFYPKSS